MATYANNETGDRAHVTRKATDAGDVLAIEVAQSEASFAPWARGKRLVRRALVR